MSTQPFCEGKFALLEEGTCITLKRSLLFLNSELNNALVSLKNGRMSAQFIINVFSLTWEELRDLQANFVLSPPELRN